MESVQGWLLDVMFGNGMIALTVVGSAVAVTVVSRIFRPGRI